ncbi:MAG: dipeptide epimerase, partial [Calditrichaeota bacterium]|nr:dipeptide epimerase [Calditrichota bacterium]
MPKHIIKKVDTWTAHLPLTRPYTITYKTVEAVENVFVRLESEDGLVGLGAGSPAPYVTGETTATCQAALAEHLQELLLGKDLRQLRQHCMNLEEMLPDTPAARTAVDLALHDLYGHYLGLPVVHLLGQVHQSLATSITIGIKETLAETLEEAEEYQGRGFRIIKLKIGRDLEKDIETVRKLHEKVGSTMKIRVDANQGYSASDLETFYRSTHH